MKKKTYSKPTVKCHKITMSHILAASGNEHNMRWSGDSSDTNGENSTNDSF